MDLFFLLFILITPVEAYTSILQTFRFPHTPAACGMHYIHSPEAFLQAQNLCGPVFVMERTEPPVMKGDYACVTMTYRTLLEGRMHASVFSNNANYSFFMLSDDKGRDCMMGHLRLTRFGRGFGLRCFASKMRRNVWDAILAPPNPRAEWIESAVHSGASALHEDSNLKAYRSMAMKPAEDGK